MKVLVAYASAYGSTKGIAKEIGDRLTVSVVDEHAVAAVHFKFESPEALGAAMGAEGAGEVLADVANYTSIAPVLQTSEIVD